ncbi:MAG: ABC transporter ATP-binding protein, partial [Patescibacteria group bacterium]
TLFRSKTYHNDDIETPVLRGVDLDVMSGEFVALMGPSGSGKSTLMHIMGFLDQPEEGTYKFQGRDVSRLSSNELAMMRRGEVGFVFQAFHLLPRLSVIENIMLPLVYMGVPAKERKERAEKALEGVGLSERLDYLPNQLSGGQKQRVAIARSLITDPAVIFADEPTGNLDSKSSDQVLNILRDLNKAGRTIVMVTHEVDAAAYASRIIRMKDGVVA